MGKVFKVFLASSGELSDEREAVKDLIESSRNIHVKFELDMWEDMSMSFTKKGIQQDTINPILKESDVVILMFHSKVGKFTKEEFDIAYEGLLNLTKPKYMYFYFADTKVDKYNIDTTNMKKLTDYMEVLKLIEHCKEKQQVPMAFHSIEDLKININRELIKIEEKEYKHDFGDSKQEVIEDNETKIVSADTVQIKDNSNIIESIKKIPKICIYTASPLNNKFEYNISAIVNTCKKYNIEIYHKILNEDELLDSYDYDYSFIFTKLNKEKIIIEDEYFIQKSIKLNELAELCDKRKTILFLDKDSNENIFDTRIIDSDSKLKRAITSILHNNLGLKKGMSKYNKIDTDLPNEIDIKKLNNFVGRDTDLEVIIKKILTIKDENKILNIKGAGGLGKTTIISKAVEEISKRGKFKDGISFVQCEYIKSFEEFENKITFAFDMSNAVNFKEQLIDLYEDENRLIILDNIETLLNIEDTKEIKKLISFISDYSTIITTSREVLGETEYEDIYELKALSTDESELLFIKLYKIKGEDRKVLRVEILENLLSNNPLAITLVANNLSKGKTTHQIKNELEENFILMTTKDLEEIFDKSSDFNLERTQSLFSSINYSYIKLTEKEQLALELLSLFPDGIHFENFQKFYNQKVDKKITKTKKRNKKLQEISNIKSNNFSDKDLKSLENKSLIINNNQYINLQSIIGRFSNFKFNNKSDSEKLEFYNKAFTYNAFLLNLIENRRFKESIRVRIFDDNKNNFLKCLNYIKHLDSDFKQFDFIDDLCQQFELNSSPNKSIFDKLLTLKKINKEDKGINEFYNIQIMCLEYYYNDFENVFQNIHKKYPLDSISYKLVTEKSINSLTNINIMSIYDMEGKQYEIVKLFLKADEFHSSTFDIGEYNIMGMFFSKYISKSPIVEFEYSLNIGNLNIQKLKDYVNSLYKTQIIIKAHAHYILLKVNINKVKLKTIKKLIITNPFTDGLKTLMFAMKNNDESSKLMYEQAIQKLYHIKYYHVEAIYLYCKYLKCNNGDDYQKMFKKGISLAKKHYYRYLVHQFTCLDSGIETTYKEESYCLPEKLDYSKIVNKYNLKEL